MLIDVVRFEEIVYTKVKIIYTFEIIDFKISLVKMERFALMTGFELLRTEEKLIEDWYRNCGKFGRQPTIPDDVKKETLEIIKHNLIFE